MRPPLPRLARLLAPLLAPLLASLGALASAAAAQPLAYVLDHEDPWTKSAHAASLLREAGFRVEPLPMERSPQELGASDVIFIASFASEQEDYAPYMRAHADALRQYAEQGRTVVQMTQADQTEAAPPFLPEGLRAVRNDEDSGAAMILAPEHPLLAGIQPGADGALRFHEMRTVWEGFADQMGFEVIIAADAHAQRPALMEAACGKGRIILSAIAMDKTIEPAAQRTTEQEAALAAFRKALFANLAQHVVNVRQGRAPAPAVTAPPARPAEPTPGSWTIAVLPDTQIYARDYPGLFTAQTGWIVQNRERRDIRMTLHLGDITDDNDDRQWGFARDAMSLLDGVIPYALVPGNHDYGPGGNAATRDTLMNDYFDFEFHAAQPTFGGAMEDGRLDNTYHLLDAGGRAWIILALEWGPRDATIEWANSVMEQHPDRVGILITHAYMNNNDYRYDHTDTERPQLYNPHNYGTPGGVNDGEELWQKLVRKHDFALTLNGHVLGDGAGYRADRTDTGAMCHQMLVNYQMREMGGEGYLRLLEFLPDGRRIQVTSYSPVLDSFLLQPDQQFMLELDFAGESATAGSVPGR